MSGKNVHVVKNGNGWAIKKEGNQRASFICKTKKDAELKGRTCAENEGSELIVHNMDGKIAWRNSYGNDPYPPKG